MKFSAYLDKLVTDGLLDDRKIYSFASTVSAKTGAWGALGGAVGAAIAMSTANTQGLPRNVMLTVKGDSFYILAFKSKKKTTVFSIMDLSKVFFISANKGFTENKVVLALDGNQYNFYLSGKFKKTMDNMITFLDSERKRNSLLD